MSTSSSKGFVPLSVRLQDELRQTKEELVQVAEQIKTLNQRKRELEAKVKSIKSEIEVSNLQGSETAAYERDKFPWSDLMMSKLKSVFNIDNFRSYQKAAINATMNNRDLMLIMPTGGGKSLCFQLPALLSSGITLVVSPLISLMEDQLNAMNEIGIPTAVFNAQTTKEDTKYIFDSLASPQGTILKLLYVTPEKLEKSKRLMSNLEKAYRLNRLSRLVIDEVHCCSTWGHDFRPAYKFLGIMKNQFPKTPIIGLTATATPQVILDVQKMLNIEGCAVFRDSFFRANLKYEVKFCDGDEKIEDIANIIKTRFPQQSGIVYCLTIKDCEDVASKLKNLKITAKYYHAQMEPEQRTRVQQAWFTNQIQVIVCTVAFGMGINKLDVRFVIHHSLSKSLENYYQETGRAGRDGDLAHCILFYKFSDVFRVSSMMMTEKNGVQNVYNMLRYCLDRKNCRKMLLAQHFADTFDMEGCGEMCDNCEYKSSGETNSFQSISCGNILDDCDKILDHSVRVDERMTPLKLMDSLYCKGNKKLRCEKVKVPQYDRLVTEMIFANFILDGFLKEDFHFTPYSTISYIVAGSKVVLRKSGKIDKDIIYEIPSNLFGKIKPNQRKNSNISSSNTQNISKNISSINNHKPSSSSSASSSFFSSSLSSITKKSHSTSTSSSSSSSSSNKKSSSHHHGSSKHSSKSSSSQNGQKNSDNNKDNEKYKKTQDEKLKRKKEDADEDKDDVDDKKKMKFTFKKKSSHEESVLNSTCDLSILKNEESMKQEVIDIE